MHAHKYRTTVIRTGLLWLALIVLLIGGSITYLFWINVPEPGARQHALLALTFTASIIGVCVILATANWWLHR